MRRVIGIVGEGPTDYMVLKEVVDHITGEENIYHRLQPEPNAMGQYGNGWKGAWKWCEDNAVLLDSIFDNVMPKLDMLIIQMDADVVRKEKEIHCSCESVCCEGDRKVHPLACERLKSDNCSTNSLMCPMTSNVSFKSCTKRIYIPRHLVGQE